MTGKAVFLGIMGRYPVGGVALCALQFMKALQDLGFSVFYVEDTGECNYDPTINGIATEPSYAVNFIERELTRIGLERSWTYVDYQGKYFGHTRSEVARECASADLLVNLSGGSWFWRDEYLAVPLKIFVDSDPGFTQQAIAGAGEGWYFDFFATFDALFTFGTNIASPISQIATTPYTWHTTIQPIELDWWSTPSSSTSLEWTTVMSWRNDSFPGLDPGKCKELQRLIQLPQRTPYKFHLALSGPAPCDDLRRHGWNVSNGVSITASSDSYMKFITTSRGEVGIAKELYASTRSGWLSDRTQCYMAASRPVIVRDTAISWIASGDGIVFYETLDELVAALQHVESNYKQHAARAREIAYALFRGTRIVKSVLATAGMTI